MGKNPGGPPELVLENRHLLGVFFVVVLLCGVFFSLGYIIGRNTMPGIPRVAAASTTTVNPGDKPSSMPPPAFANQPQGNTPAVATNSDQSAPTTDLNFYQNVEQKAPDSKLEPQTGSGTASALPAATAGTDKPATSDASEGYLVQVSAVTKREDADNLVAMLKQKNLPVLVTASTSDSLFHVVVGPYKNEKDAEHAKAALELDGFRPIIKR
jgi:DedD protein